MTTIRKLIEGAMRLNRVIATNETPTDADIRVGQDALATMLDSMQVDLLNIYTTTPRRFLLEAGKQAYTLGPAVDVNGDLTGANWITERPVRVEKAVILQYPSVVYAVDPTPPPVSGLTFSRNGSGGLVLRSAQSQMTDFTDWTGNNEALSTTANDWDVANLPAGSVVTPTSFTVPGEAWAVRSVASFSDTDISRISYCEFVYTADLPEDLWFGVINNGTNGVVDPAPEILSFDPNQGLTLEQAGGQYYALYNPATATIRNSSGTAIGVSPPLSPGDVIGLRFDNYLPGTPVLPTSVEFFVNGVLQAAVEVPYTCFDGTRGNVTAAIVKGSI